MILYHYCSNQTFQSVINKRAIWLSSLSLSNDSMEGRWIREVLSEVCADEKLDEGATKRVIEQFGIVRNFLDGLGFCLSEHGDMLSQWRGYANDASGMCIGFSKDYLEELSEAKRAEDKIGFSLSQVVYDTERQKAIVKPTYEKIIEHIKEGALQRPGRRGLLDPRTEDEIVDQNKKQVQAFRRFSLSLLKLFPEFFRLKNPAFDEEREWRLISYLIQRGEDEREFRASSDRIIPYRVFGIPEMNISPISEVILGPKNITPVAVIESFLKQREFADVKVVRSKATYR